MTMSIIYVLYIVCHIEFLCPSFWQQILKPIISFFHRLPFPVPTRKELYWGLRCVKNPVQNMCIDLFSESSLPINMQRSIVCLLFWDIRQDRFSNFTIELHPIIFWELSAINIWVCMVHPQSGVMMWWQKWCVMYCCC